MDAILFKATTLPDAWFTLMYALIKGDVPRSTYEIDKGSYVGERRLEFQYVTVQIDQPGARPLIPEIPPLLNLPPPVDGMDYVDDYFAHYLMGTELKNNEMYIYGTWLAPGIDRVIKQLKGAPGNNQAAISIGGLIEEESHYERCGWTITDTDNRIDPATQQRDPACLRCVDFRLDQSNTLHMCVYFRSWDLWGGFPANLAGLQLVKEYVAQAIGAKDGKIIAASKGLHIYSHAFEVAAKRVGMNGVATMDEFLACVTSHDGSDIHSR